MVTTTFCVSGAALRKAGLKVNTNLSAGTVVIGSDFVVDTWIVEAENVINAASKYDYKDAYSSLDSNIKYILQDTASCMAAMQCINYDMSGYTSRLEAQTMLDILRDTVVRNLEILKLYKVP